jgi:hypothetical protein
MIYWLLGSPSLYLDAFKWSYSWFCHVMFWHLSWLYRTASIIVCSSLQIHASSTEQNCSLVVRLLNMTHPRKKYHAQKVPNGETCHWSQLANIKFCHKFEKWAKEIFQIVNSKQELSCSKVFQWHHTLKKKNYKLV